MHTVSTLENEEKPIVTFNKVMIIPLLILFTAISSHYLYQFYLMKHFHLNRIPLVKQGEPALFAGIVAICFLWLINSVINQIKSYFAASNYSANYHVLNILIGSSVNIFKGIVCIVIFNQFFQNLHLPKQFASLLNKGSSILIILATGWIILQLILSAERVLVHHFDKKSKNAFNARKIVTQLHILKRIAIITTGVLVSGSILMLFDNVRALGASVLTTAGIIGLVMTFTAQKTLGGLFAGIEIALTQPIKIGDAVVIQNEFGIIEEINLRNVVIKLWDWRRLIVPTNHFLEQPFQNWSREESNNLIGTVYLYVDFTQNVDALRAELKKILIASPLWDGNVNTIQVTDLQDKVMQLRVLSSADSPSKAWDLRCEVREKLISFIARSYPECLPVSRSKTFKEVENQLEPA